MVEIIGQNATPEEQNKKSGGNGGLNNDNGKKEVTPPAENKDTPPVTDFKIAEIWIKSGQLYLEAAESFWSDKCRAVGVLEICKDIVKNTNLPSKQKIIPVKGSMMNYAKSIFGKRRR